MKINDTVTNIHVFVYITLKRNNISVVISDLIQTFIRQKPPI